MLIGLAILCAQALLRTYHQGKGDYNY